MEIDILIRTLALSIYKEWFNNYLSIEVFAEKNGLEKEHAEELLSVCRKIAYTHHPSK